MLAVKLAIALTGIGACLVVAIVALYVGTVGVLILRDDGVAFVGGEALIAIGVAVAVVAVAVYGAIRINRWYTA
jgi:hypothetical protein